MEEDKFSNSKMVQDLTKNIIQNVISSQEESKQAILTKAKEEEEQKLSSQKKRKNKKNKKNKATEAVQKLTKQSSQTKKKEKKVEFRLKNDVKENNEFDELEEPRRASSKGSSGNEEVFHQNTMSKLDNLFPREQKTTNDNVKTKIKDVVETHPTQVKDSSQDNEGHTQKGSGLIDVQKVYKDEKFTTKKAIVLD